MRCPKCHYLSFDPEPRCRNCGYDLEVPDSELALRTAEPDDDPVPDLALRDRPSTSTTPLTLELVRSDMAVRGIDEFDQRTAFEDEDEATAETGESVELPATVEAVMPQKPAALAESADAADHLEAAAPLRRRAAAPDPEPPPMPPLMPAPVPPPFTPPPPRLALVEDRPASPAPPAPGPARVEADPEAEWDDPAEDRPVPFRSRHATTADLPLFVKGIADHESFPDEDVIASVPPARPPLAVRRARVEPPLSSKPAGRPLGPFDRDLLEDLKRVEREEIARLRDESRMAAAAGAAATEGGVDVDAVEPSRRIAAAAVDVAVLGSIATFVFWATLRLCDISLADLGWPALVPLFVFIAAMDLAYLLMFTAAGGQTVGKMLLGIRVVADDLEQGESISLRQAAWRAALTFVSVIGLGLGWLPALFGRGLTLHDRLAHTRVVRA